MMQRTKKSKLNVIGLGYIGFPTALIFASSGVDVIGTDLNPDLITSLNQSRHPYDEPGLNELFTEAIGNGIRFTTACEESDYYLIAVPTPFMPETKKIDATYIVNAVKSVLDVCPKGATIIIESTISPGTIDTHVRPLIESRGKKTGVDCHLVHAPERIIPGNMIFELENNPRTIGADDALIAEEVKGLYSKFCKAAIVLTDIKSAEMSKIVENTYRDINIAYANELAKICNAAGIDVYEVIRIANLHPRVNVLPPGPGVGGHCIPVDPWFLVGEYPDVARLINAARVVNDTMPAYVLTRILEVMTQCRIDNLSRVGVYGLAYKENVDDYRESPGLQLLEEIQKISGIDCAVYDPHIRKKIVANQKQDFDDFLSSVDMVVILTAHNHLEGVKDRISEKVVLDTRNALDLSKVIRI